MDHYIPKRRVSVTVWAGQRQGVPGHVFLDLDAAQDRHQTLYEKLNESSLFLPVSVGADGRTHLFNKSGLTRVTPGRSVLQSDVFTRGFQPWREEEAEIVLADATVLAGKVWMPLERQTQRLSDFLNRLGEGFFVLITPTAHHLVSAGAVTAVALSESAGAPLGALEVENGSPGD